MKNVKLLVVVLMFGFLSSAQNPQLFENTWYLQKLVLNGVDYPVPQNNELEFIELNINQSFFATLVCLPLQGDSLVISNTDIFVSEFIIIPSDPCTLNENNIYESLYYNDFFEWQLANRTFDYTIENQGTEYNLVLTNMNGDEAYYGSELLSAEAFEKQSIAIFPNPVLESFYISIDNNPFDSISTTIYNLQGALVFTESVTDLEKAIDIRNLSSGVYFVVLKNNEGGIYIKRILKR